MLFVVLLLWVFCLLEGLWCHQHNSRLADWSWYSRPVKYRETVIIIIESGERIMPPHPLSHKEKKFQLEKNWYIHIYEIYIKNNDLKAKFYLNLHSMIIGASAKPRHRFTKELSPYQKMQNCSYFNKIFNSMLNTLLRL